MGIFLFKIDIQGSSVSVIFIIIIIIIIIIVIIIIFIAGTVLLHSRQKTHLANMQLRVWYVTTFCVLFLLIYLFIFCYIRGTVFNK